VNVSSVSLRGNHILAELYGMGAEKLNDEEALRGSLREVLVKAGANVLDVISSRFDPYGVTALALLAESHASIHTYPEVGGAFVDFFTCGEKADSQLALDLLVEDLGAEQVTARKVSRGPLFEQTSDGEEN